MTLLLSRNCSRTQAAGIYGVTFFLRGRWRMVWVDSYFPCCRSSAGSAADAAAGEAAGEAAGWLPMYARSTGEHEAWLMVVEKVGSTHSRPTLS